MAPRGAHTARGQALAATIYAGAGGRGRMRTMVIMGVSVAGWWLRLAFGFFPGARSGTAAQDYRLQPTGRGITESERLAGPGPDVDDSMHYSAAAGKRGGSDLCVVVSESAACMVAVGVRDGWVASGDGRTCADGVKPGHV